MLPRSGTARTRSESNSDTHPQGGTVRSYEAYALPPAPASSAMLATPSHTQPFSDYSASHLAASNSHLILPPIIAAAPHATHPHHGVPYPPRSPRGYQDSHQPQMHSPSSPTGLHSYQQTISRTHVLSPLQPRVGESFISSASSSGYAPLSPRNPLKRGYDQYEERYDFQTIVD
jgi:hypothetical protein